VKTLHLGSSATNSYRVGKVEKHAVILENTSYCGEWVLWLQVQGLKGLSVPPEVMLFLERNMLVRIFPFVLFFLNFKIVFPDICVHKRILIYSSCLLPGTELRSKKFSHL